MIETATDRAVDRDALRECVRSTLTRLSRTGELPTLPAAATAYDVTVTVPDLGGGAPAPATFSLLGNYDVVANAAFTDTVEASATAWQVTNTPASLGATEIWQRLTVSTTDHRWAGASASQAGTSDLVSPAMFVSASQPLVLTFRHRYSFESPVFDGGVIEITSDGGTT